MFPIYFFPSARRAKLGPRDMDPDRGYGDLLEGCLRLELPRVPQIGEEVIIEMIGDRKDGELCTREVSFMVYEVTTTIRPASVDPHGEPIAFQVHLRTDDSFEETKRYRFPPEME